MIAIFQFLNFVYHHAKFEGDGTTRASAKMLVCFSRSGLSARWSFEGYILWMKKTFRETQTLRAGSIKADPKIIVAPQQTLFPRARDGQNLMKFNLI